jgi:hypothetical protein
MWGKYLHNEWKYYKFGAQGKLILLQEVLSEEGIVPQPGLEYQKTINQIFPRTFYCEQQRKITAPVVNTILKYFGMLELEFTEQGLPERIIREICYSETAEKFCIPVNTVKEIVKIG